MTESKENLCDSCEHYINIESVKEFTEVGTEKTISIYCLLIGKRPPGDRVTSCNKYEIGSKFRYDRDTRKVVRRK